jgi:putative hydrolase of the HAD superfamily
MIKSIIFDLDNTLYRESDYVHSGLMHVTSQLYSGTLTVFNKMMKLYTSGSKQIFGDFLRDSGTYSREKEMEMVYLYRSHVPKIKPFTWVVPFLKELGDKKISTGILTNGRAIQQSNKLKALGILNYVDRYIIADIMGEKNWKPYPMPYKIMMSWLVTRPEECLYVDDCGENLIAATSLGMQGLKFGNNEDIPKKLKELIG